MSRTPDYSNRAISRALRATVREIREARALEDAAGAADYAMWMR